MVNYARFYYTTDLPVDRVIYTANGTHVLPTNTTAGSGSGRQTFAHNQTIPFVPVISYSEDGTNWYSNGQFDTYYDAGLFLFAPRVWAVVAADNTNVYIDWQTGNIGQKTVQYRINGIMLDV